MKMVDITNLWDRVITIEGRGTIVGFTEGTSWKTTLGWMPGVIIDLDDNGLVEISPNSVVFI